MAKDSIHFAVTPTVRENLIAIATYGMKEGADFTRHGKASRSALIRYTIERAAKSCEAPSIVLALPQTTGTTDADRLRAAMGTMTPIEACRAAGLKDSASIRNVTNKGAALAGKLLVWVESVEAGR